MRSEVCAPINEPLQSPPCVTSRRKKRANRKVSKQTKRPPRKKGGLFFQGRIVLTEGKIRQNFLAESYGPKKGGVKEILDIKCLCFQTFTKFNNSDRKRIILRCLRARHPVKRL